jgi:hypothetical protein
MLTIKVGRPLLEQVNLCYAADLPLLLIGRHGVGKSESLKAAADELGIDFLCRDLSLMEPPDLIGLPVPDEDVTRFRPPSFLPTKGKGLLVFEELNRCEKHMRSPCLQLLTDRSLNDYRLPSGWLPMACINPPTDAESYDVDDLDPALLSRFVQVQVEPDVNEWLAWAAANGVHPSVVNYIATDGTIFDSPVSNPRSWKYVSDLVHAAMSKRTSKETLRAGVMGLVGDKRGTVFMRMLKDEVRTFTADQILDTYGSHRSHLQGLARNGQLDQVKAAVMSVLKKLQAKPHYEVVRKNRKQWGNLGRFLDDLPGDLKEEAQEFFKERNYDMPNGK